MQFFLFIIDPCCHLTISNAIQPLDVVAALSVVLIDSECNGLINLDPQFEVYSFGVLLASIQTSSAPLNILLHPTYGKFAIASGRSTDPP